MMTSQTLTFGAAQDEAETSLAFLQHDCLGCVISATYNSSRLTPFISKTRSGIKYARSDSVAPTIDLTQTSEKVTEIATSQ